MSAPVLVAVPVRDDGGSLDFRASRALLNGVLELAPERTPTFAEVEDEQLIRLFAFGATREECQADLRDLLPRACQTSDRLTELSFGFEEMIACAPPPDY